MTERYKFKYHCLREAEYNEVLDLLYQACWVVDDLFDCCGISKNGIDIEVDENRVDKEEIEELKERAEDLYDKIEEKHESIKNRLVSGVLRGILEEVAEYLKSYIETLDFEYINNSILVDYSEEMGELLNIYDDVFWGIHEHKN